MHCTILRFEETPNPDAIKCVADRVLAPVPRSYNSPEQATADPLARDLFSIPGVKGLLILHDWFTVRKDANTSWRALMPALRAAVAGTSRRGTADGGSK